MTAKDANIARNRSTDAAKVDTNVVRSRPRRRSFNETEGPLSQYMRCSIPGFKLRIVTDKPGRINRLRADDIGYEFVNPTEIDLRDIHGAVVEGDKVRIDLKQGEVGYLLKIPEEFYNEDAKLKIERNLRGLQADVSGFKGSSDASVTKESARIKAEDDITFTV